MSNVFLSAAIRLCCDARVVTKPSQCSFFSTIVRANALGRRFLVDAIPQKSFVHGNARIKTRSLSIGARLQANKQRSKAKQSTIDSPNTTTQGEDYLDSEAWRQYDPVGGLPLPNGEHTQEEINQIFPNSNIDSDTGNYILSVLHWRRMSGALIDVGIDFPKDANVSRSQALQGLEYLRETYPSVDEPALGARWAEEESQRMRQELQDRAVKLGLYKPAEKPEEQEELEEEVEEESQQGTPEGRERSGTSAAQGLFAALRARNIEKEEQRVIAQAQKERSILHAARGPLELAGGVQRNIGVKRYGTMDVVLREPDSIATLRPVERKPWVKYYEAEATIVKEEVVPELSTTRRLLPSFLVMLFTLGSCFYMSENYTPPSPEARLFPSIPPSVATVGGVTAVLLGCFFLSRIPQLWRINNEYFCLVPAYPYAISNIGAIFRHDTFSHLATNVITLWLIGLSLHEDVGRGTFLAIFLGAGVVGTYSTLAATILRRQWTTFIYGSSGAVLGILGALCVLRPNNTISVFGYDLPIAAWLLLVMVAGVDLAGLMRKHTNRDHIGHLGGLLSGAAAAAYLRSKYRKEGLAKPVIKPLQS